MAAGTNKNVSYIAFIAIAVPILIGMWFAAPMFLPMFKWTKIDIEALSKKTGIPKEVLGTEYTMKVRYQPRGEGDPLPWQIIESSPTHDALYPEAESEEGVLVRCTFISANDGQPPSTTFINSTWKDRYWKCVALRLPAGSLGFNAKRPVVVYNRLDLTCLDISNAEQAHRMAGEMESDDDWRERDDGYEPPGQ
jgi:hypothetical protein